MADDITFVLRAKNDARKAVREFSGDVRKSARSLKETSDESRRSARNFRETADSARRVKRETDGAKDEMRGFARQSSRAKREVDQATRSVNTLRASAAKVAGVFASIGVGVGLAATVSDAVRVSRDFEAALSEVQAVSQATEAQFEALSARARELGATTSFSATQAAEGIAFLARAGFDAGQAFDAIGPSLQLARAGALDLASAADIASNILSGLQQPVSEFNRLGDVLAFTAANANTNIQQLGKAFSFVAPQLSQFNISAEEGAAAIGLLSNAGIQGARAGTNLRGVLARLVKPSSQARDVFEQFGVSLQDVNPASNDLSDILEELAPILDSASASAKVFGTEIASGANILISMREELDELTEGAENSEGALDTLSFVMGDNLDGAVKELRSSVEELYLSLVNNRALTEFVQLITAIVREITPATEGVRALGDGARDSEQFMKELSERAEELEERLGEIRETAQQVVGALEGLGVALGAVFGLSVIRRLAQVIRQVATLKSAASFVGFAVNSHPLMRLLNLVILTIGTAAGAWSEFRRFVNEGVALPDVSRPEGTGLTAEIESIRAEIEELEDLRRQSVQARKEAAEAAGGGAAGAFATLEAPDPGTDIFGANEIRRLRALRQELEKVQEQLDETEAFGAPGTSPDEDEDDQNTPSVTGGAATNPIRQLTAQVEALREAEGLLGAERRRFIESQQIANQARAAGVEVTRETVAALLEERDVLDSRAEIGERAEDLIEQFRREREAILENANASREELAIRRLVNEARARGVEISEDQIAQLREEADAIEDAREAAREAGPGITRAIRDFAEGGVSVAREARGVLEDLSRSISDTLISALDGGEARFSDFILNLRNQVIEFVTDSAVRQFANLLSGGGGQSGGGGIFDSLIGAGADLVSSLFGGGAAPTTSPVPVPRPAAFGTDFVVKGSGGVDSQFVPLRATPGERVTVTRPEDERGGGGDTFNISMSFPGIRDSREARATKSQVAAEVAKTVNRGRRNL